MKFTLRCITLLLASASLTLTVAYAAPELVYLDAQGVIRWAADKREVALFGANYSLPSASDYRAAGYIGADRKKLVEKDMVHFARMGWDGMRLCFWGDWENCDKQGNLIVNDHLDLMDYAIAQAKQRGIFILFTPITTYSSVWPDGKDGDELQGFSKFYKKGELGTNPDAIAAQCNYLRQIMEHVNPYTGIALKDEPAILFVEMINEPDHHSGDLPGSIAYIDALADAVRGTGCTKLLFHNLSQDFNMAPAIKASKASGVSFAWYPTGLNSRHELEGNYLRAVDSYPPMLRPDLLNVPKIVYEFDSADMSGGYMYPAMVRAFRGVGAQFAAMFSYDMLDTAPYNLGWQTHFLNLVYSPRKAVSAIIAAEAMRALPRYSSYGDYPDCCRFGPFRVSYVDNTSEMATDEQFLYASDTATLPPRPESLRQIVGLGSSKLVEYPGKGSYFLDKIQPGVWRLEVYPDAVSVQDPFAQKQNYQSVSVRLTSHAWPMSVRLPDLGESFAVAGLNAGNGLTTTARGGRFDVHPGVYLLSKDAAPDRAKLPERVGRVGLTEFVCPPAREFLLESVPATPAETPAGKADKSALTLFEAARDSEQLAYTRIGDAGRRGIFKNLPATATDPAALRLFFPLSNDRTLNDYTASLSVGSRLAAGRGGAVASASALRVRARGSANGAQPLYLTLVEVDGTAWTQRLDLSAEWREIVVPLDQMKLSRGVSLPQGFPGQWDYWINPAKGRGGPGDHLRIGQADRVQFSFRPIKGQAARSGEDASADVALVSLGFD